MSTAVWKLSTLCSLYHSQNSTLSASHCAVHMSQQEPTDSQGTTEDLGASGYDTNFFRP